MSNTITDWVRIRRLSLEAIWVVLGQVLAVIGSLLGVRFLTELLDPRAYGELSLAMTILSLANLILIGPLSIGATRFYAPAAEKGDLPNYFSQVRNLLMQSTGAICFVLLIALICMLILNRSELADITIAATAFALLSGTSSLLGGIQNSARQRSVVALHQGAEPWLRFLIASALLILTGGKSETAMMGYALASFLVVASQYVFFRKLHDNSHSINTNNLWRKQILTYSWPFSAWGIFTWIHLASDRWSLEYFSSTEEVGLYVVLYQIGFYPVSIATGMAVQFIAPILFKHAGDAKDDLRNNDVNRITWRLTGLAILFTSFAGLIGFGFHIEIFSLFVSERYASVTELLPLVVISGGLFAAGQALALQLMALSKTKSMVFAKIFTAIFGLGLNIFGARFYGAEGVVYAGLMFSLLYLIWMAVLCHFQDRSKTVNKNSP